MLSYEHIYHAGNHADILKHVVFSLILQHLKKKSTPFTVIDTHAGSGIYSLNDERAQKTLEADSGILRYMSLMQLPDYTSAHQQAVELLKPFTEIVTCYSAQNLYAGSPEIARCLLRKDDTLILSELHPQAIEALRENMHKKTLYPNEPAHFSLTPHIHYRNGFELLAAMTPPSRGIVLVDPSYEELADFTDVSKALCTIHNRWRGGILALWYPLTISKGLPCSRMRQTLISCVQSFATENRVLDVQLTVQHPENLEGKAALFGSGMLVVNYPYQLDKELEVIMPLLEKILAEENGKSSMRLY